MTNITELKPPIILIGNCRSGTTMLHHIFNLLSYHFFVEDFRRCEQLTLIEDLHLLQFLTIFALRTHIIIHLIYYLPEKISAIKQENEKQWKNLACI